MQEGMGNYEIQVGYDSEKNPSRPYKYWLIHRGKVGVCVESGYALTIDEAFQRGKDALAEKLAEDEELNEN